MSNYLQNLAARSLNLMPVIQPKLASRFEPQPDGQGTLFTAVQTLESAKTAREGTSHAEVSSSWADWLDTSNPQPTAAENELVDTSESSLSQTKGLELPGVNLPSSLSMRNRKRGRSSSYAEKPVVPGLNVVQAATCMEDGQSSLLLSDTSASENQQQTSLEKPQPAHTRHLSALEDERNSQSGLQPRKGSDANPERISSPSAALPERGAVIAQVAARRHQITVPALAVVQPAIRIDDRQSASLPAGVSPDASTQQTLLDKLESAGTTRQTRIPEGQRGSQKGLQPEKASDAAIEAISLPRRTEAAEQRAVVAQVAVRRHQEVVAPALSGPSRTSKAEPTIQITIGRIEVRATPAAQQASRSTPKVAAMSLDEYLGQRNGGRR